MGSIQTFDAGLILEQSPVQIIGFRHEYLTPREIDKRYYFCHASIYSISNK